jgi:2-desacetyl-2-hydroxyethyl bacteriochlorophyllide A dehydrogenase
MKALVYHGPRDARLEQVPEPIPKTGEVRLRIMATGICGSDVHGYLGLTGRRLPPMIMGHEFAGIVDALGDGVDAACGIKTGMRATVQPVVFCGSCIHCRRGETNLCLNRRIFGVMSENGSMAEYLCVPALLLVPLPQGMSMEQGAMAEAAAVAYGAVRRAGGISGKDILVVGAGPIGLLILQMAKAFGSERVFVSDPDDNRLKTALLLGASKVVNPGRDDLSGEIPGGVDVSFEAVGITPAVAQTVALTKNGGTAVWVGNSQRIVEVDMQAIVTRKLNVLGSYIYTHQEFIETVQMLDNGLINCDAVISHRYPLDSGAEVLADMAANPGRFLKVILTGHGGEDRMVESGQ